MALTPGTRLAHYEIVAAVGRGGMGEVYRARDTRLDRDVAIKISAQQFSERFDREGRAIAALNHPNICTLFDLGSAPEAPGYLVMEYIEGESPKGPLPLETVLDYARQIAAALEDAHAKGVVHRDLKPANIKVTPSGLVKVLDFGLAKMNPGVTVDADNSPTLALSMTEAGVILGTAAYMAPEQARGKAVDRRADIWAFGVVLYELLTGRPLFKGADVGETLASVIKETPSWDGVPATIQPLLKACLEKDPARRLRDIGDAWRLVELGTSPATALSPASPKPRTTWPAWAVAGTLAAALTAVSWTHFREVPVSRPEVRFQIPAPASAEPGTRLYGFRLSPDGQMLAMVSSHEPPRKLYVRRVDSFDLLEVPGTEGAGDIFWAPDSASIGFFAGGKLKRVGLDGRAPRVLADAANSRGGAWNRDGVILFTTDPLAPLMRLPADGGTAEAVTKVGQVEGDRYPEFLPDQNHFLYLHATNDEATEGVYVASLDGRTAPRRLLQDLGNVAFVPGEGAEGHLLYRSQGALVTRAFNTARLELVGAVRPVADAIRNGFDNIYWGSFSATAGGLTYWTGARRSILDVVWIDRNGRRTAITEGTGSFALSPDGKRLAFGRQGSENDPDLWVMEVASGRTFRAATGASSFRWSPDGQELALTNRTAVLTSVFRVRADGGSKPERLGPLGTNALVYDWSPDGKWLLAGLRLGQDIVLFSMEDGHPVSDYVRSPAREGQATLSPDGKWVAYSADESAQPGQSGVFVQAMPLTSARYPIGRGGVPRWSRDGRWLYFATATEKGPKLMVVPITTTSGFEAGAPREVLDMSGIASNVEPSPDGRFIGAVARPSEPDAPITVVLNWKP